MIDIAILASVFSFANMRDTSFNIHHFVGPFPKDHLSRTNFLNKDVVESNNNPFPQYNDYNALKDLLREGKKDMAKSYIEKGCPLNKDCGNNTYDGSPLHLAVSLEYPDIVELLLEKGASVKSSNDCNETPLMLAAIVGNNQIIDMILSKTTTEDHSNYQDLSHLHIACMRNNVNLVQKLLASGADINKSVSKISMFWPGFTPLHFAIEFKSIKTAKFLINNGADITIQDNRGLTPLHLAFRKRNRLLTELLLSKQFYYASNPVDSGGLSHFHIACAFNKKEIVEDFLDKKVDVKHIISYEIFKTWCGYCGFEFAIKNQCINVLEYLIKVGATIEKDKTHIIDYAFRTRNLKIVNLIISFIEKSIVNVQCSRLLVNSSLTEEEVNYSAPDRTKSMEICSYMKRFRVSEYSELHAAVLQKNANQVSSILDAHSPYIITVADSRKKTPLHLAFETNQKDLVDQLLPLHLELDENPTDSNNFSHFHISCTTENVLIVEDFIRKGVDINIPINMDSLVWAGNTPLHLAIIHCRLEVVQLLLNNGADFTLKNALGVSPYDLSIPSLHSKFIVDSHDPYYEDWDFARLILLANEHRKLDNFDDRGITLLHIASANDDIDMINRYVSDDTINKKTNENLCFWSGFTPLHFAACSDRKIAMKVLLDKGADPTIVNCSTKKFTAAYFLYSGGDDHRMLQLPENVYNYEGISTFHVACRTGNLEGVQHFLKMGVDVRERLPNNCEMGIHTLEGKTPLHLAVEANQPEIVELLLENGAEVDARDCYFNTSLHFCENSEVLKILLDHGADPEALNCDLHTALESAIWHCSEIDDFISTCIESGWDINSGRLGLKNKLKSFDNSDLVKHIERLTVLGFNINDRCQDIYDTAVEGHPLFRLEILYYRQKCIKELNLMKNIEIDGRTTLHDVLFKSSSEMAKYSKNETLQKIIELEKDLRENYPIYAYLLILQFKKGIKRASLLEKGKKSLSILMNRWMCDLVFEMILQFMNDHEITFLNYAASGQNIFQ